MKILMFFLIFLFVSASLANADYCIKEQSHTDGYYYGGEVTPPVDRETETWIGDKKLAYLGESRIIIYDLNDNILVFINKDDSTYAETTLPLEWQNLCDEQAAARIQMFPYSGTIEETGETKKIENRTCKEYAVSTWIPYQGTRYYETDSKYWMTTDVPFDVDTYDQIMEHIFKLRNYGEELRAELGKLSGLLLVRESETILKGYSYKSTDKVIEISAGDPPTDVYSPPAGFTKKEKLTLEDLRGE